MMQPREVGEAERRAKECGRERSVAVESCGDLRRLVGR